MSSYQVFKAPLIVDPDASYLEFLSRDPAPRSLQPWLAGDAETALRLMKSEIGWISGLVINPTVGPEAMAEIIHYATFELFGMQIYFLCEPAQSVAEREMRLIGGAQILEKPMNCAAIVDRIENLSVENKKPRRRVTAKGLFDDDFASIAAKSLNVGGALSVDIYIRLCENRFVRVLAAGDALDERRLTRYLNRGLTNFYTRKSDRDEYVRVCENLSAVLAA